MILHVNLGPLQCSTLGKGEPGLAGLPGREGRTGLRGEAGAKGAKGAKGECVSRQVSPRDGTNGTAG